MGYIRFTYRALGPVRDVLPFIGPNTELWGGSHVPGRYCVELLRLLGQRIPGVSSTSLEHRSTGQTLKTAGLDPILPLLTWLTPFSMLSHEEQQVFVCSLAFSDFSPKCVREHGWPSEDMCFHFVPGTRPAGCFP